MMTGQLEQFNCEGCGKQYRWKPELAGKRVKCKCGHTMTVPQPPPVQMDGDDDPFADALSAMAEAEHAGTTAVQEDLPRCPSCASEMSPGATVCVQCGYNVKTGKAATAKRAVGMGVGGTDGGGPIALAPSPTAAASVAKRAPGGVLAYAGMPVRSSRSAANAGDNNVGDAAKDLYLPLGLFLLGIGLTFCEARYGQGIANVTFALLFTAFTVVINLVLVFAGIMLAVRLLSLGLGPIGPALLKIAAISVVPGAISGMLIHVFGSSGFFFAWIVNLILIYAMFMGMLELDFQETAICGVLIWFVRTWIGYALVFAILHGMGMAATGSGSRAMMAAMSSSPSTGKLHTPKKAKPLPKAADLDAKSAAALARPEAMEAKAWTAINEPNHPHSVPRTTDDNSQYEVEMWYRGGAKAITITHAEISQGRDWMARQIVITLPDDKDQRLGYFYWGRGFVSEFNGTTMPDVGQKYLMVDLDGKADPNFQNGTESDQPDDEGDSSDN